MELKLYTFSKRKNSTKQPANTNLKANKSVYMKRETSVMSPTFLINNVDLSINYCKWDNNYYFVNDIVLNDEGMYELRCTMDVLATCKSSIQNTTANIMYCTGSTRSIVDKRIPVKSGYSVDEEIKALSNVSIMDQTVGAIVLAVTGAGSFGSYLMENGNKMSTILDGVDSWWPETFSQMSDMVKQLFYGGSASENFKSAISIPLLFQPSQVAGTGTPEQLILGSYPCCDENGNPLNVYKITKPILFDSTTIDIPWKYDDWRRNPPYSQVCLYVPFVGLLSLPTADIINETQINVLYAFNVTSGDFSVEISAVDSNKILSVSSGNIATQPAIGSKGVDTNKMATSIVGGAVTAVASAVTAYATGGMSVAAAMGIAGGMSTAVSGTIEAFAGQSFGNGGASGSASQGLDKVIHCYVISRDLTEEPSTLNDLMGKPFFGKGKISDHSGYVQTEGFSLSGSYLEPVITQVNSMMDAGVYIE